MASDDPRKHFPPVEWDVDSGYAWFIQRERGIRGWWKRFAWRLWRRKAWLRTNPTFFGRHEDFKVWDDPVSHGPQPEGRGTYSEPL